MTVTINLRRRRGEDEEVELVEIEMGINFLDVDLRDVDVFEPEDHKE